MHIDILETSATESELHDITGAVASPQTCSVLPSLACSWLPPTFSTHLSHDPSSLRHLPLTSVSNIPVKSKKLSNIQHPTSCIFVYNSLGTNSHNDDLRTNATTTFHFPNTSRCPGYVN